MEKIGFINAGGELQEKYIIDNTALYSGKAKAETIYGSCKNEKGDNVCETAYKIFQCLIKFFKL